MGNPVMEWETSKQFDLGLDLLLFNNSLEIVADYFRKDIDNMLMQEPLPTTLGFPMFPYSNVGSMRNTGWEFGITYRKAWSDFNLLLLLIFLHIRMKSLHWVMAMQSMGMHLIM